MNVARWLLISWSTVAGTVGAQDYAIDAKQLQQAAKIAPGERLSLKAFPIGFERQLDLEMKRIEVYAPDAEIRLMTPKGPKLLPRSEWRHFLALPNVEGVRFSLSLAPDGKAADGYLIDPSGSFALSGSWSKCQGLRLHRRPVEQASESEPATFACGNLPGEAMAKGPLDGLIEPATFEQSLLAKAGSHSATVAVETDNEFLAQKFSGSQANATTYLANLFAAFNVIYERDLNLTLLQGNTTLWDAGTPDPYSEPATAASGGNPCGGVRFEQLQEFGNFWQANRGGVSRAFAMMLSGKMPNNNCSAGIAWLTGASNMCTATGGTGGHYSFSQVFKFAQQSAAQDVGVVGHELGHNFGANHTHCTDAATGNQPVSSNTVDQCFSGESGLGCFGGTQACPAAQTVNGVANVRGTLMSYCHLAPSGCAASNVFADIHRTRLTTVKNNNVGNGCFPVIGGGGGTFSINDAAITEGNAGTQNLTFTVTRSNTSGTASVVVNTANNTATAGSDYTAISNLTLNFAAAEGSKNVNVVIQGDTAVEANETFNVNLSNPSAGYTLADGTGVGTITNDDTATTISVNDPSVSEGNAGTTNLTFTLTLSATSASAVSVTVATANGTATTANSDYVTLNTTANITAGQLSTQVNVVVNGDTSQEADETVLLNLSNPSNATIADSQGIGTILDDDSRIFGNSFE